MVATCIIIEPDMLGKGFAGMQQEAFCKWEIKWSATSTVVLWAWDLAIILLYVMHVQGLKSH